MTDGTTGQATKESSIEDSDGERRAYDEAWVEATLQLTYWGSLPRISADQAALLICGWSPHEETVESVRGATNEYYTAEDFTSAHVACQSADASGRTLAEWVEFTQGIHGVRLHPWVKEWYDRQRATGQEVGLNTGHSHVSRSPAPISPVRGGRASAPRPAATPPNWQEWRMLEFVEPWEAAALSLGLEPRSIARREKRDFPDDSTCESFLMRDRTIESADWHSIDRSGRGIRLSGFVAWAIQKGIEIPGELRALEHKSAEPQNAFDLDFEPAKQRPPLQQRFQEQQILNAISELGFDPQALPKRIPGKRGVKADVRDQLNLSVKVFDLAWERLRANREISDEK